MISGSNVIQEGGTMYLTTSSGYPYIYHNGVAYFHTPEVASVQQPWPVSNWFFCICFAEVQDKHRVSKSLLLPVSPATPYLWNLNGFLVVFRFKIHYLSLLFFCGGALLWCDLVGQNSFRISVVIAPEVLLVRICLCLWSLVAFGYYYSMSEVFLAAVANMLNIKGEVNAKT